MKELVIDRTKWYRGNGSKNSRLLRSDGTMCCLGFYSLACGLTPENIIEVAFPSGVDHTFSTDKVQHKIATLPSEMEWLAFSDKEEYLNGNSDLQNFIGEINDSVELSDAEREQRITAHFAAHDVAVTFIN